MHESAIIHRSGYLWQQQLRRVVNDIEHLCQLLEIDAKDLHLPAKSISKNTELWRLRVPLEFVQRMKKGDPKDPLLLQVLPQAFEQEQHNNYIADPLQEKQHSPKPGIIHKYHGRALLITTGACAIHCRYCFRREFEYSEHSLSRDQWQPSLDYIRATSSIEELILSGGDPLILTDQHLQWLITEIASIPHIKRLRIHTRLPIVIPSRITEKLLTILTNSRLQTIMVVHCNHPNEIDDDVHTALNTIADHGITLLNQTVLLKGINDNANSLITLSQRLFSCRVLPYYLHLLDPVNGSAHFDCQQAQACDIMATLAARLPGYLVPKLTREIAGKPAKTQIPFEI